jgi:hypothetical protein
LTPQDTNSVLNNSSLRLVFLFCGYFLSACSTTGKVASFTPSAAEANQAIVYIYRPNQMANALYSPGLLVNDEFKFYLKNALNSRLSLEPGRYVFAFQNEKKYSELTPLTLNLKAGSTVFIRVASSLKINNNAQYEPYARNFMLSQIDASQAIKEITECCIISDKKLKPEQKEKAAKNNTGDGFSVDKTQNPFSH